MTLICECINSELSCVALELYSSVISQQRDMHSRCDILSNEIYRFFCWIRWRWLCVCVCPWARQFHCHQAHWQYLPLLMYLWVPEVLSENLVGQPISSSCFHRLVCSQLNYQVTAHSQWISHIDKRVNPKNSEIVRFFCRSICVGDRMAFVCIMAGVGASTQFKSGCELIDASSLVRCHSHLWVLMWQCRFTASIIQQIYYACANEYEFVWANY